MNVSPILVSMEENAVIEQILIFVTVEELSIKEFTVRPKSPNVKLTNHVKTEDIVLRNHASMSQTVKTRHHIITATAHLDLWGIIAKLM